MPTHQDNELTLDIVTSSHRHIVTSPIDKCH